MLHDQVCNEVQQIGVLATHRLRHRQLFERFQADADQALLSDTLQDKQKSVGRGEVRVKAGPSLEAIRNRGRSNETTVEDVLEAVSE